MHFCDYHVRGGGRGEDTFRTSRDSHQPVTANIETGPFRAVNHFDGINVKLVVHHLHLLGILDIDRAWGDSVEDALTDGELVSLTDAEAGQWYMGEVALVDYKLLYS